MLTANRLLLRRRLAPLVLLGGAAIASCQGGVVDGQYQGKELARIQGQVLAVTSPAADSVSLAIVWTTSKEPYAHPGAGGAGTGAGGTGDATDGGFGGAGPDSDGSVGTTITGGGGTGSGEAGSGGAGTLPPGAGGAPAGGAGGGAVVFTATTVFPIQSPGPSGSLLDPPMPGCDGQPAAVVIDKQHSPGSTPIPRVVSYQASFPLSFTIPITTLPPAEALIPLDVAVNGSGVYASGRVVAFIDEDRDNQLDLPSPDAVGDTILAVSREEIAYLSGVFPVPEIADHGYIPPDGTHTPNQVGWKLPQGFSLLDISQNVLPASTPIQLPLAETPFDRKTAAMQVCASWMYWIEHFSPTQTVPDGANILHPSVSGLAWSYYPDSGNPCLELAFLGQICE